MKNVHMCLFFLTYEYSQFWHLGHNEWIGVTEGKKEISKKESKMRISILIFIYILHFAYLKVYTKFHNPKSSNC